MYETSLIKALTSDGSHRDDALNCTINNIEIDTCFAPDTGEWETGIYKNMWIIVEHYEDKNSAVIGHKKWCDVVKDNPNSDLIVDCEDIEYGF
jgi:hypothetical protein